MAVNKYEDYKLTKAIQEEIINPSLTICYDFEDEDGDFEDLRFSEVFFSF